MRRQGLRWAMWGLVALVLLAAVGRIEAASIAPLNAAPTAEPEPPPAPPRATRPVTVLRQPVGLPETPVRVAFGRGVLWVAGRRSVYHVVAGEGYTAATDLRRGAGRVLDVAAGAGGVWLAVDDPGSVWRLDAAGAVASRIPLGRALTGTVRIAVSDGGPADGGRTTVWVACCGREDGAVLRVDPAANRVVGSLPMANGPTAIAADAQGAVVTTQLNELVEISAATGAGQVVLRNNPGSLLRDVALTADAEWLAVPGRGVVLRRSRADGRLQSFRLPRGVRGLAAARARVWALSEDGLAITPLSDGSSPPFGLLPVGDDPARQLVVGGGRIWLVPEHGPAVVRVFYRRR